MAASRKPAGLPPHYDPEAGPTVKTWIVLLACLLVEGAMFSLFFGAYAETMSLGQQIYMAELPLVGPVFAAIDPDTNAGHLLAALLAVFSVGLPIALWNQALEERVFDDPQGWIAQPANRIKAVLAGLALAVLFTVETVNLYTLIAQENLPSPFLQKKDESGLMEMLATNQALGVLVSLLIAIVNAVLGLLTVRAARSVTTHIREG